MEGEVAVVIEQRQWAADCTLWLLLVGRMNGFVWHCDYTIEQKKDWKDFQHEHYMHGGSEPEPNSRKHYWPRFLHTRS